MNVVEVALLVFTVAAALLAVLSKDLFVSVVSLGAVSVGVGGLYFALGLNYAGAFELNAGAGLTTVMFVAILGMVSKPKDRPKDAWFGITKVQLAGALVALVITVAVGTSLRHYSPVFVPIDTGRDVGTALWRLRAPDILALGLLVFSGALGISAMFHREKGQQDA